jgi:hypothetical protein
MFDMKIIKNALLRYKYNMLSLLLINDYDLISEKKQSQKYFILQIRFVRIKESHY